MAISVQNPILKVNYFPLTLIGYEPKLSHSGLFRLLVIAINV